MSDSRSRGGTQGSGRGAGTQSEKTPATRKSQPTMKFKCTQENLSKALATVNKAVSVKATLPILGNILFTAKGGTLSLSTTNLETSIQTTVHASVEEDGIVAVPAKLFTEFVSTLTPGALEIVTEANSIKIASASSNAKFTCMSAEDFPAIPSAKAGVQVGLNAKEFTSAVAVCAFCAAVGDSRPALTGALLKKIGSEFVVVATDGFRLSEKKISLDQQTGEDFSLLVPAKTLSEVSRMFSNSEEALKLSYSSEENLAVFQCDTVVASIRVLDGEFPDYTRIIPQSHTLTARVASAELLQSIKLANVFAKDSKEGNNLMRMTLDPSGDCSVYSATAQSGEGSANLKMEVEGAEPLTLSFNSKYLLDFLNAVRCEDLEISTNGESVPCMFRSPQLNDFLHLIMPVKVNN